MRRLIQYVLFFSLLFGLPLYSLGHVPRDSLAFEQVVQIGRGRVHYLEWHTSDQYLLADAIRGAWIYDEQLQDVAHVEVQNARFSPDGQWLLGGDDQNRLVLVDTTIWQAQKFLRGHHAPIAITAWHPLNPDIVATVDESSELIVWDIAQDKIIFRDIQIGDIRKMLWSPFGNYLAVMNSQGQIMAWDMINLRIQINVKDFETIPVFDFKWQSDTVIVRTLRNEKAEIWDIITRQISDLGYLIFNPTPFYDLQTSTGILNISPNQKLIADVAIRGLTIRDLATNEILQTPPTSLNWSSHLQWSHNSLLVAYASNRSDIHIWNVDNNQLQSINYVHTIISETITWSPKGEIISTGGYDSHAYLWDTTT